MNVYKESLIFKILGTLFLILLVLLVISDLSSSRRIELPSPLPIGSAFDGNAQIPVEEFKAKYQHGMDLLNNHKASALTYKTLHNITDWAGFGLTSLITLIVGFSGKVIQNQNDPLPLAADIVREAQEEKKRGRKSKAKKKYFRLAINYLGILAALASVSIALSNRFQAQVESNVKNAMELNTMLSKARTAWFNAKTVEDAQQALNELETEILKRI
jgi:hypothetical protein